VCERDVPTPSVATTPQSDAACRTNLRDAPHHTEWMPPDKRPPGSSRAPSQRTGRYAVRGTATDAVGEYTVRQEREHACRFVLASARSRLQLATRTRCHCASSTNEHASDDHAPWQWRVGTKRLHWRERAGCSWREGQKLKGL